MDRVPATIKFLLSLEGYTQADVAEQCGVAPNTVWAVVHGRGRSRRIESRIAAITGRSPAELWPQWYSAAAKRERRRRKPLSPAQIDEALRAVVGR